MYVWQGTISKPFLKSKGAISELPSSICASHESDKHIKRLYGIMKAQHPKIIAWWS